MGRAEKRRCLSCGETFTPEPRNARHQRYCGLTPCKVASKRASQAKWLAKPENRDYHRGPEAVARVQAWRAAHPGYSRRPETVVSPEAAPQVPEHFSWLDHRMVREHTIEKADVWHFGARASKCCCKTIFLANPKASQVDHSN